MIGWLKRFRLLFTALFFLILAVFLFTLHVKNQKETSWAKKAILQVSFPVQQKLQGFGLWVKGIGQHYLFLTRVQEENQALKQLVSTLKEENNRLREAILAEERLKKLYPLQAQHPSATLVAQVFARDPSSWFKTLLVNKGEKEGVAKDMVAVVAEGVVGRVVDVSPHTAKILLVTDPNSAVDAIVQRTRTQGILEGRPEEISLLKYVPKTEDVQVGDKLITSGMGGIYPKGLMIGTVAKVEKKRQGIFQHIEVTPNVDFSKVEEVLLLKGEP